jgi:hypothetical protein
VTSKYSGSVTMSLTGPRRLPAVPQMIFTLAP